MTFASINGRFIMTTTNSLERKKTGFKRVVREPITTNSQVKIIHNCEKVKVGYGPIRFVFASLSF